MAVVKSLIASSTSPKARLHAATVHICLAIGWIALDHFCNESHGLSPLSLSHALSHLLMSRSRCSCALPGVSKGRLNPPQSFFFSSAEACPVTYVHA